MVDLPSPESMGFIRNLKGGWMLDNRNYPSDAVTGRPLYGAYASGFACALEVTKGGKPTSALFPAPPGFAVGPGGIKLAIETLGATAIKAAGDSYTGKPVNVTFTWQYMPGPTKLIVKPGVES